jgi:hypothetical protein
VDGEKPSAWRAPFLAALEASGNISASARRAGVGRATAYRHRAGESDFREAWDEALEVAIDALEGEARRRALEGWDEPVFFNGSECGRIRKYDSTLLIFLLKAHRPEKFRDNVAVQHDGELTIRIEYVNDWREVASPSVAGDASFDGDPAAADSWHSSALAGAAS